MEKYVFDPQDGFLQNAQGEQYAESKYGKSPNDSASVG